MTERNQRYRSDVTAAMADEQASDDVNKIQQQEGEDGEIDDEVDDEATIATGMGARPKTTVTSAPTKTTKAVKQPSRRDLNVQQRRETRSTTRARQEVQGAEAPPPTTTANVDAPVIKINGQSQIPVDKSEQNYQYQSSRQHFGMPETTGAYQLPPPSDFDYQTRYRRRDDDDVSEHNYYRNRRTQSAEEKSRYTFEEWADQILNSPHMRKYMQTRQVHVGQQPQFYQPFQPVHYPTYSHQSSVAKPSEVHLFVPPAPTPPSSDVSGTSMTSVAGQQSSQQRGHSADAQLGNANRTQTQDVASTAHVRPGTTTRQDGTRDSVSASNIGPLDTSTPTASSQQGTTARRSRRDSLQRTPTLNVSKQSDAGSRRRKSKNKIEFVPARNSSDTQDTSTLSDTEDSRGGSKTRVRVPTFNGTDFHVYKELFTTSAEYAGWSEREKKIHIISGLRKPATDILSRPGRQQWSSNKFLDELEKAYGQNRPFTEVQTELLSMRRKLKQDLYTFASELRAVAMQARMEDEQREWLLRTAFMLGIENYPNTRAYVERESKDKVSLQEAVDLAIKYERDYPIEHTASRIAAHTAQSSYQDEGQYCEPHDADINWIPRGHYNSKFQRGGRHSSYGGYRNQQYGHNQRYQAPQISHWQQKVYELEKELDMWRTGAQLTQQYQQPHQPPAPQVPMQQQQPAYGAQYYNQQYRPRYQHGSRPYRGQQSYRQQQYTPRYQQQWQPRPYQQYQHRAPAPRQQTTENVRQQQPAVHAMQTPHYMTAPNDEYAQTAPMASGNSTMHEHHDSTRQVMFQEEPHVMAAPGEESEDYDTHSQEHSQDE